MMVVVQCGVRRASRAAGEAVSQGAGAVRRMHSPRDMGKRNAEERAAGACDLDDSLTTTGVFCLCSRSSGDAHFAGHLILAEP